MKYVKHVVFKASSFDIFLGWLAIHTPFLNLGFRYKMEERILSKWRKRMYNELIKLTNDPDIAKIELVKHNPVMCVWKVTNIYE